MDLCLGVETKGLSLEKGAEMKLNLTREEALRLHKEYIPIIISGNITTLDILRDWLTLESTVQRQGELIDMLEKALKDILKDDLNNANIDNADELLVAVSEWRKEQK